MDDPINRVVEFVSQHRFETQTVDPMELMKLKNCRFNEVYHQYQLPFDQSVD